MQNLTGATTTVGIGQMSQLIGFRLRLNPAPMVTSSDVRFVEHRSGMSQILYNCPDICFQSITTTHWCQCQMSIRLCIFISGCHICFPSSFVPRWCRWSDCVRWWNNESRYILHLLFLSSEFQGKLSVSQSFSQDSRQIVKCGENRGIGGVGKDVLCFTTIRCLF